MLNTKTLKKLQKSLQFLKMRNKYRKPYQLLIHPSFFNNNIRSYDTIKKIFGVTKLLVTECTYKHIKNSFMTHCEIRNCKKKCAFFVDKFGKQLAGGAAPIEDLKIDIATQGLESINSNTDVKTDKGKNTINTHELCIGTTDVRTNTLKKGSNTIINTKEEAENNKEIHNEIHACLKNILKGGNKFRYILVCSDEIAVNEFLGFKKVPILEIFRGSYMFNLSGFEKTVD
ncbi:hypothetical protein CDIK_1398 [Cucumispora dikerogammari]|nr:hypothetical protein CDIK_1398 [Cucumispora dikerogammari]